MGYPRHLLCLQEVKGAIPQCNHRRIGAACTRAWSHNFRVERMLTSYPISTRISTGDLGLHRRPWEVFEMGQTKFASTDCWKEQSHSTFWGFWPVGLIWFVVEEAKKSQNQLTQLVESFLQKQCQESCVLKPHPIRLPAWLLGQELLAEPIGRRAYKRGWLNRWGSRFWRQQCRSFISGFIFGGNGRSLCWSNAGVRRRKIFWTLKNFMLIVAIVQDRSPICAGRLGIGIIIYVWTNCCEFFQSVYTQCVRSLLLPNIFVISFLSKQEPLALTLKNVESPCSEHLRKLLLILGLNDAKSAFFPVEVSLVGNPTKRRLEELRLFGSSEVKWITILQWF